MSAKGIFIGNLTRDPEPRESNGTQFLTFGLAVRTNTRDESGAYVTDFYDVSTRFNMDFLQKNMKKGNKVQVLGNLKQRVYKSSDGSDRFGMQINGAEVELLVAPRAAANDDDDELPV